MMTRFSAALSRAVGEDSQDRQPGRAAHAGLSRDELFWRLRFTLGALHHALLTGSRDEWLPAHLRKSLDAEVLIERLVSFSAAGLRARAPSPASPHRPDMDGLDAS
jgi:hypothetical protein